MSTRLKNNRSNISTTSSPHGGSTTSSPHGGSHSQHALGGCATCASGGCMSCSKGGADESPNQTEVKVDTDEDNIYINVNKYNPLNSPDVTILTESNITQGQAVLDDPSQYRICCERFTIPSSVLPLFIYPSDAVAESIYRVEVYDTLTEINSIKPLQYVEWNQGYSNYERGVYYYQFLLSLINDALYLCFVECAQNPLFTFNPDNAPTLNYEPSTQLFYWNLNADFISYFTERLQIRLSIDLYDSYFPSFAGKFFTDSNHLQGQILFIQNQPLAGMTNFNQYNQSPCIGVWSSASKILVLSNTIPVSGEVISSKDNKSQSVLMDFEIDSGSAYNTEPFQFYSNLHRWYDMYSTQPLNRVTVPDAYRSG